MKHIILAAGKGTRMKYYTTTLAKGMLPFGGMSILQRQIDTIKQTEPEKIIIVKGYRAEDINFPYNNIKFYTNENYEKTNMVESLMNARKEFNCDITVSYGDILFSKKMLNDVSAFPYDFVVAVDTNWKKYWKMRYDQIDFDTESLKLNRNNEIIEIGRSKPLVDEIDARYIGLLRFSKKGLLIIEDIYDSNERWKTAYMTDLLQEIIDRGYPVTAMPFKNGWIEFDTVEDIQRNRNWLENGILERELNLKL